MNWILEGLYVGSITLMGWCLVRVSSVGMAAHHHGISISISIMVMVACDEMPAVSAVKSGLATDRRT